jgi:hypothetical protein
MTDRKLARQVRNGIVLMTRTEPNGQKTNSLMQIGIPSSCYLHNQATKQPRGYRHE